MVDRDPLTGDALGSQPTLSRFENAMTRSDLYRVAEGLADVVIGRQRAQRGARVRQITIDLDHTDDPTHGQQELAFFHGYYGTWCYLPLLPTLTFDDEPRQHLVAAWLRPGRTVPSADAQALLRRLLPKVRAAFPAARLRVRLDAGFAGGRLPAFLEAQRVDYAVSLQGTAKLERRVRRLAGWMFTAVLAVVTLVVTYYSPMSLFLVDLLFKERFE